jgi:hypothetical protein
VTPTPTEARLQSILTALDALPPEALEAAAAFAPGPAARVLRLLAEARVAPDRGTATQRIIEENLADLDAVARLFGGRVPPPGPGGASQASATAATPDIAGGVIQGTIRGALAHVDAALARADALAASLGRAQTELGQSLDPLIEVLSDDEELHIAAKDAAAELRDPAIAALTQALVADAAAIRDAVRDAASLGQGREAETRASAWLAAIEPRIAALEARAREATALGQALPSRVAPALARIAELARTKKHASAAHLAQVDARMEETVSGLPAASTRVKWRRALDLALGAKKLDLAWVAGKRVQVEALDIGDKKLAALVAHRVADLAAASGSIEAELTARMEEALLLVRLDGFAEQGRAMSDTTLARAAAAPPHVQARVGLMAGQLQEVVGDDARARILYRRVMQHKDAAGPAELGRAALHLGRLELRAGQPAQGRKNVRLAYDLALKNADAMLYAEAVPTLIESLLEAGREPDAAAVVQEARARYSRLGHIDAFKADLERRWGASRVATWWA